MSTFHPWEGIASRGVLHVFFSKYKKVQQTKVRALGRGDVCTFLTKTVARWCFAMLKNDGKLSRADLDLISKNGLVVGTIWILN